MNSLVPVSQNNLVEIDYAPAPRAPVAQATSLERMLAGVYRQRWLAFLIFAAVLLAGLAITLMMQPKYTAVASVQLEQQAPRVLADADLDPQVSAQDSERFLQTQIDHLRSRNLATAVADQLNVANNPVALKGLGIDGSTVEERREEAISKLQSGVSAELGLNTRLARIEFTSQDPVLSARAANAYADGLAAANLSGKIETSTRAKQYLTGQLGEAKKRLEASERQMLAYARAADLTTTVVATGDSDKGGSLRAQQLGLMTDSLSQATARRIDAQQRWAQVSGASAMSLPEVQDNRAVQELVAQRAQAEATLQEERERHTDAYPSVREAAAKIRELDGQIAAVAANIKSSFAGRYRAAAQQERQMASTVGSLRGAAMSERERSVGYNSLQREVETNRTFYEGLLQRYKAVAAASGAPAANVTIVDRASPPAEPSSPDLTRNMALASMAGLVLAFLFGSARDRMHDVIRSTEDLETTFNLPPLGIVPVLPSQHGAQLALSDGRSPQSEAYNSIAVALEEAAGGELPKTLLITSSGASEGKSTSAVGIAKSLTAMGKRVLLIDGDLRRPSLHQVLGSGTGPGLSEVLTGAAQVEDAIRQNEEHGFDVVNAGEPTASPVTLLSTHRMQRVLDKLMKGHDIVIIDGPPVMGLADAVLLSRSVEAVLVIVEANRVHSSQLDLAVSRLPGSNVIGAVLTKFDAKSAGVRYGGTDYYAY
jgi:capsular exopolysaccharide synthesis family protein